MTEPAKDKKKEGKKKYYFGIVPKEELKEEPKTEIKEIKIEVNQDNIPEKNEISELEQKKEDENKPGEKTDEEKKLILENKDNNVEQNPQIEIINTEINIQSDETNINKDKTETQPEKIEEKKDDTIPEEQPKIVTEIVIESQEKPLKEQETKEEPQINIS